ERQITMKILDGNPGAAEVLDLEQKWEPIAQPDDVDGLGAVTRPLEPPDMKVVRVRVVPFHGRPVVIERELDAIDVELSHRTPRRRTPGSRDRAARPSRRGSRSPAAAIAARRAR